jgi:hypothetical protein
LPIRQKRLASKRLGARQLALSCDQIVVFEGVPDLVLKFTILRSGQSFCDLVRSWYRVELRPRCSFGVKIHQLANLEFVFGHDRLRLYGSLDRLIGSTIEGSSFSGLLTRVEIGHIRIGSAGNGLIRSPGSGSSLSQRM